MVFSGILATALGEILLLDRRIPDLRYRRQVGETRDDRASPLYRNLVKNPRRRHKPILRNDKPFVPNGKTFLHLHEKPVLPISQKLLLNSLEVFLRRSNIRSNDKPKIIVKKHEIKSVPKDDGHKHWIRKDERKQSKRENIVLQKLFNGNEEGNKDVEDDVDAQNVENDIPNGETVKNDLHKPEIEFDPSQPEIENEIPEIGLSKASVQKNYELENRENEIQGYIEPEDDKELLTVLPLTSDEPVAYNPLGQGYNSRQGQNQGISGSQVPIRGFNAPQKLFQRPITHRSLGHGYQESQEYNVLPLGTQSLGQDFDAYQEGQMYTPQMTGGNQDFNAYQTQGLAPQTLGQNINPPQAPYGPNYAPSDLGQNYNGYQGAGQNYNPPQEKQQYEQYGLGNVPDNGPSDFSNKGLRSPPSVSAQEYSYLPSQNQINEQGQIWNPCQVSNCQTGQCYPNDFEVRKKMLKLIRDTKLAIDMKVMPIREAHAAYKSNIFYKIGYLVSSIKRTHDSVVDFYKFVAQNINNWDMLKILQAYEQVKLAEAFVTDILYTLNQLAGTVSIIPAMRLGKTSYMKPKQNDMGKGQEQSPIQSDKGLGWSYYDD